MRLSQADFARRKGVNRSTVTRWVERGRMSLAPDGFVDVEEAEKSLALTASPYAHHAARAEQIAGTPVAPPATRGGDTVLAPATGAGAAPTGRSALTPALPVSGSRPGNAAVAGTLPAAPGQGSLPLELSAGEDAGLRLKVARAKREEEEAQLAQMKRQAEAKLLLPRATVEFVMADIGRVTAALLDRIADRYTPTVVAAGADPARVHAVLSEAARDVRNELAHHAQRKSTEALGEKSTAGGSQ